jgi:hemerythrin
VPARQAWIDHDKSTAGNLMEYKLHAWSGELSVGNKQLDRQHQKLIEICNLATDCAKSGSPELHIILNDFAALVDEHFEAEEILLEKNGCPTLEAHKASHDLHRERIVELLLSGTTGQVDGKRLAQVASAWLLEHMTEVDLPVRAYMKA